MHSRQFFRFFSSKINFNIEDALNVNSLLTQDELLLQHSTKTFCAQHLSKRVVQEFRNESNDPKIFKEFGELGLLGCSIKGYGCAGVSQIGAGLVAREIERIDSGYRSMYSVQSSLVMGAIDMFGTESQKKKYLPELAKGNLIGCFGLTEPDAGSDVANMSTKAVYDSNNSCYIVNGAKTWISNAPIADICLLWAKSEGEVKGFIVEKDMAGYETNAIQGKFGLRTSVTGSISLNNVKVPKENELPLANGYKAPFTCLNSARFGISFGVLGAAESCFTTARQYMLDRVQFNKPLAGNQIPQMKFANMISDISLGLVACVHVGRLKEKGLETPEMISILKRNNCGKALEIARMARDMLGGNGISDEYHVVRHLLNLEVVNTYEGTHDIHALILGRAVTGIQAFQ